MVLSGVKVLTMETPMIFFGRMADLPKVVPNRVLLLYLNTREVRFTDAAEALGMDPNTLRQLALSPDRETGLRQAQLVGRLRRHYG